MISFANSPQLKRCTLMSIAFAKPPSNQTLTPHSGKCCSLRCWCDCWKQHCQRHFLNPQHIQNGFPWNCFFDSNAPSDGIYLICPHPSLVYRIWWLSAILSFDGFAEWFTITTRLLASRQPRVHILSDYNCSFSLPLAHYGVTVLIRGTDDDGGSLLQKNAYIPMDIS